MTTDNTQELDEILEKYGEYYHLKQLNRFSDSEMQLNFAEETDIVRAKQAILNWHNKQVEEVLDRLSNALTGSNDFRVEPSVKLYLSVGQIVSIRSAIEAERNKLKESSQR